MTPTPDANELSSSSSSSSSDEVMRKLLKPNPTHEQVIEVLTKSFVDQDTTKVTIHKQLDSYDDCNYWVTIGDTEYLAKIHNGVESKDLLDCISDKDSDITQSVIYLQTTMMNHLCQHGVSTSQPQVPVHPGEIAIDNTDKDGNSFPACIHKLPVVSADHSPCPLVVRLMSWVPGRPMESIKLMPLETLADAGRFLGQLQQALSKLPATQAAKRYHQWDGKNTADLRPFVSYIQDPNKRALVTSIIDSFQKELIDTKVAETSFPKALIHGDFNDANILVNSDLFVSGVIDFGDSVESWKVLDLSVAMAYAMMTVYGKQHQSIAAAAAFLRGYSTVTPLSHEEKQHLVLLIACRLACSATLGAYSYQQAPENEYLLLHSVPAWNTLNLLWGNNDASKRAEMKAALDRIFDLACTVKDDQIETMEENDGAKTTTIDCSDLAFPDPSIPDPFQDLRVTVDSNGAESTSNRPAKRRSH